MPHACEECAYLMRSSLEECVQLACEEYAYLIRSVHGFVLCLSNVEAAQSTDV